MSSQDLFSTQPPGSPSPDLLPPEQRRSSLGNPSAVTRIANRFASSLTSSSSTSLPATPAADLPTATSPETASPAVTSSSEPALQHPQSATSPGKSLLTAYGLVPPSPVGRSSPEEQWTAVKKKKKLQIDPKRNEDFHRIFRDIPGDEILADEFSATLSKDVIAQGKLYITLRHICFSSPLSGLSTNIVIPYSDIITIEKKSKRFSFRMGIQISTLYGQYHLSSFVFRDQAYSRLVSFWKNYQNGLPSTIEELMSQTELVISDNESLFSDEDGNFFDGEPRESFDGNIFNESSGDETAARGRRRHSVSTKTPDNAEELELQEQKSISRFELETNSPPDTSGFDPYQAGYQPLRIKILDHVYSTDIETLRDIFFSEASAEENGFMGRFMTQNLQFKSLTFGKWVTDDNGSERRQFRYTMDLKQTSGKKENLVINYQKYIKKDQKGAHYILEHSSETPDIPNGDCFRAVTLYSLSSAGPGKTRVIVTGSINFHKATWIKSFIESHAIDGIVQYVKDLHNQLMEFTQGNTPITSPKKVKSRVSSRDASPTPVAPKSPPATSPTSTPTPSSSDLASPEPDKPTVDPFKNGYEPLKNAVLDKIYPVPPKKIIELVFGDFTNDVTKLIPTLLKSLKYRSIWAKPWEVVDGEERRQYGYIMDLNGPIGPKFTTVTNTQRWIKKDDQNGHYLLENVSTTPDVPSGDCFKTINMYSISHVSPGKTRLISTGNIVFTKNTWIKSFIESHGTAGYIQYGVDLDILLNKVISADPNAPAPTASGETATAPPTAETHAPAEEPGKGGEVDGGATQAASSSKLRYYVPFFEILALLFGVLLLNLFIFVYLRTITGAIVDLDNHVLNTPKRGKFSHELEQHFYQELSGPKPQAASNLLLSKLLANHVQEGNLAVESINGRLFDTQAAMTSIAEELESLKKNRDLLQTGLLCVMATEDPKKDPETERLCTALQGDLKKSLVKG